MSTHLNSFIFNIFFAIVAIAGSTELYAAEKNESQGLIYIGAGSASTGDPSRASINPSIGSLSIGYLWISDQANLVLGFDTAVEGNELKTRGGTTSVMMANSYNLLVGQNIHYNSGTRIDAAFLLGGRTSSSSCPRSYLGYECYADAPPKSSYSLNYGAVLTMTYKSLMVGLRATGESTQFLVGFKF